MLFIGNCYLCLYGQAAEADGNAAGQLMQCLLEEEADCFCRFLVIDLNAFPVLSSPFASPFLLYR